MKKSLLLLAVLCAMGGYGTVYAQSNATIYGLIDATFITRTNADTKGDRFSGFQPTPWFSGSRWGIHGHEDLGSDLKLIYKLESEYLLTTGEMDTPGVLFNRDAWVGFESKSFGKFTVGRQNSLGRDFAATYLDPYGPAKVNTDEGGGSNTNNFKQMIFYAGSATGTRMDNGLVWKKAFDNGLVAGLGYQLGEVAGSLSKNTTKSAGLGYNFSNFALSGFYTQANVNDQKHDSYSLGGSYVFDIVRLNAGYFHYTADQALLGKRKDDAFTVSAKLTPRGAMDYEVGYQVMKANNAALNGGGNVLNAFADATGATATDSGKKATLYGSAFYHFTKRTEVYVAADYMKLTDGYRVASTNGFKNQTELAVGLRTRF